MPDLLDMHCSRREPHPTHIIERRIIGWIETPDTETIHRIDQTVTARCPGSPRD